MPGREATEFSRAVEALRAARLRPEVRLTEVPAPQRIAPYAVAMTADVLTSVDDDDELATGRFTRATPFGPPGDYEGLASDGDTRWVLRSDGLDTELLRDGADLVPTRTITVGFHGHFSRFVDLPPGS